MTYSLEKPNDKMDKRVKEESMGKEGVSASLDTTASVKATKPAKESMPTKEQKTEKNSASTKTTQSVKESMPTKEQKPLKVIPEDKHLRMLADFENYKKRVGEQLQMCGTLASKRLIKHMLPVLHEIDLAIAQPHQAGDVQGLIFIHKKLLAILNSEGLEVMEVAKGDVFDADRHEALSSLSVEEEEQRGKIAQIVSKGYTFSGEVIAFTKVIVNT